MPHASRGITDHGSLSGLSDDDHTQYHNDTRGDARYYTQSEVEALLSHVPAYNAMPDSGRFAGASQDPNILTIGSFATSTWFNPYNGAATWTSAGQFFHNNTTNGGSAGVLTQDVIDLLAAMGRTGNNARYGSEFFIGQSTSGSGTAAAAFNSRRLFSQNDPSRTVFGATSYCTWAFWIRAKSGDDITIRDLGEAYLDGVLQSGTFDITQDGTSDGWHYLMHHVFNSQGQQAVAPGIYCNPSTATVVQIACPIVVPGKMPSSIMHTAPVMSLNGNNT